MDTRIKMSLYGCDRLMDLADIFFEYSLKKHEYSKNMLKYFLNRHTLAIIRLKFVFQDFPNFRKMSFS
jgi:hypothetical protein